MPQVRKNPLPVGRYWIYILGGASQDIFDLWLKKNSDVVKVETKEAIHDPNLSQPDVTPPGMPGVPSIGTPLQTFYVFNVLEPSIWPRGVGFPNAADTNVHTTNDVTKRPPIPTVVDVAKDIAETAAEAAARMRDMALVGLGLYLLWRYEQGGKR